MHLDRIVELVEQTLSLHKQLAAKTDHEKTAIQRQIDATDQRIDRLVYELYGLTDEEIKIVEVLSQHFLEQCMSRMGLPQKIQERLLNDNIFVKQRVQKLFPTLTGANGRKQ